MADEEATVVEEPTELEKLKTSNDEMEKELVRGRELKAESQKLEMEKMTGGKTEAGQEVVEKKEESNKDYRARITKEMGEGKTEFSNGN